MKKIVVLIIVLIAAISAGAYIYFYQPIAKETQLVSVMPADTVGMVRVSELKKQIERFRTNHMGQSLAKIDLPQVMDLMGIPADARVKIDQFLVTFKATIDSIWLDMLFGQDVALALFPVSIDATRIEDFDPRTLFDAAVLVARPKQPTRLLESLNDMFSTQIEVRTETYKQWEIKEFALQNGMPVYYALAEGLLIAGLSLKPVQRCLDQSLDAATSLLQAESYKANCAGLYMAGKTDLLAYMDIGYLFETGSRILDSLGEEKPVQGNYKSQLEKLKGLENLSLASYDDGGPLVQSSFIVGIDRNKMVPVTAKALSVEPAVNTTLQQVPAKILAYTWQNNFDMNQYWQEIRQDSRMTPEAIEKIKTEFAQKVGIELEKFMELFGNQAGLLIKDINMGGMFPIPEIALFIEPKQPDSLDRLIKRQAGQFGIQLQQEAYNGADITYTMLPTGADMSPAYTLNKGFFTIAINRELLKTMLDVGKSENLVTDPHFKAIDQRLSDANNQVMYVNTEALIVKIREIVTWGRGWMAMVKPEGAEKNRQIVELVVNPILDGLSMFKAVGVRIYSEETRIICERYTYLDRHFE